MAGNGNDRIYVVKTDSWVVERLLKPPGRGLYNLEPTPDWKKLVVPDKAEGVQVSGISKPENSLPKSKTDGWLRMAL